MGGRDRQRSSGAQDGGGAAAIALGTVLDGVPESVVLGTTLVVGSGVSWAILATVFLSNLPESMAATTGLLKSGARPSQLMLLWGATTLFSGIAAGLGYTLLGDASGATVALVQAFAAGALLSLGVRARRGATAGKAAFGPSFRVTRQRVRDSSRLSR
jgi:zinc transporter, ZIP family